MPQVDRHKNRTVNIEFTATEDMLSLPYPDRFTIVFITSGSIKAILNNRPIAITAPGMLCLSEQDKLQAVEKHNASVQSFRYHPDFLNTVPLSETEEYFPSQLKIQTGISLFQDDPSRTGVPIITEKAYLQLFEWFFVLGTEVYAQSDVNWVCRIKKYLIQILGLIEDLNRHSEQSPVDLVLEYIHTNYADKINLADLTNCAHLNRVSLNKLFHERCGCTAMEYLISHRLKVAGELLTHTGMSLNEIAHATGFEYDTYFIKQFTAKKGLSPTEYRKISRQFASAQ